MRPVTTDVTFEIDGRVYGPFQTHQLVQYLQPFSATMPTGASYIGLDNLIGRLVSGTVTLLCLTATQAVSIRVNNRTGFERTLSAGGIFLLANYQGVLAQPPDIQNNSGSPATVVGVIGGLV